MARNPEDLSDCPRCGGTGVLDNHSCPDCDGTGDVTERERKAILKQMQIEEWKDI